MTVRLTGPVRGVRDNLSGHSNALCLEHPTTSTVADRTTSTVADPTTSSQADHGRTVSGAAHNDTNRGCAHGHAVAAVASDGWSHGQPCHNTPATIAANTTPNANESGDSDTENGHRNRDASPPTAVASPGNDSQHDGSQHNDR